MVGLGVAMVAGSRLVELEVGNQRVSIPGVANLDDDQALLIDYGIKDGEVLDLSTRHFTQNMGFVYPMLMFMGAKKHKIGGMGASPMLAGCVTTCQAQLGCGEMPEG